MALKLYNTIDRKKEEFKPLKDKQVGMYVCGPTVYDVDHLGHARTFIFFDLLRRFLTYLDYQIKFVSNITDVGHLMQDMEEGEDKIEKRAKEEKTTPEKIARFYEQEHFKDMASLNVLLPDVAPRATEHIPEMISFIEELIKKGYAYESEGNVYFDVSSLPSYGELSGREPENMRSLTTEPPGKGKKDKLDFALWKKADPAHIQKWPSPWGLGYPGWHIECSAMSMKYLGVTLDIHGSANEHIFPHHENERAQSEARTGQPFVRYWVHSGMLRVEGVKMSKSLNNFVPIKEVLKEYSADEIRLAFFMTHYRSPFDYKKNQMSQVRKVYSKLTDAYSESKGNENGPLFNEIIEALEDDLNTPKALSLIQERLGELTKKDFEDLKQITGISFKVKEIEIPEEVKKLIKKRESARAVKEWEKADRLREKILEIGYEIEDTPTGTQVKKR